MSEQPLFDAVTISKAAKLPIGWCEYALDLIVRQDVSGVVSQEIKRQQQKVQKRNELGDDRIKWKKKEDEADIKERGPHLYASKEVRPLLLESIAVACWKAILRYAQTKNTYPQNGSNSDDYRMWLKARPNLLLKPEEVRNRLWIQRQIGLRLGTDVTNIGRWERDFTVPDGDKVLGAILIPLGSEIAEVQFPTRVELLSEAAARTLSFIHAKRYGGNNRRAKNSLVDSVQVPRKEDLAVVREVLRRKSADVFVPLGPPDSTSIKLFLKRFIDSNQRANNNINQFGESEIKDIIGKWASPYVLFRIALVCGWTTVDGWNWSVVDQAEWSTTDGDE